MPRSANAPSLRDLRLEGRLIPFVGAGLSRPLGLPSWDLLIDKIAVQLGYDPDIYRLNGSKLQLAEFFVAEKGSIKGEARWDIVSQPAGFPDATGFTLTVGYKRYF